MTRARGTAPLRLHRGVLALVLWLGSAPALAQAPGSGTPRAPDDAQVFQYLDGLFGTTGAWPTRQTHRVSDRAQALRRFVRGRLEQDAFYPTVLPQLFSMLVETDFYPPTRYVLKSIQRKGRTLYYLNEPCADADAKAVPPWWNLREKVWICEDSYRPEIVIDRRSGKEQRCGYSDFEPSGEPPCRCGAYLIHCARDEEQMQALSLAVLDEPIQTMRYVIQSRRPFSDVLRLRDTVRSDWAELFYAKNRYYKSGVLDFAPPRAQAPASPRPRDPEFSAGVLTTPHYLFWESSRRLIVSMIWEDFLCTPLASTTVKSHQMFDLGDGQLRTQEHQRLAAMTGCKECHARIESAVQALRGFTPPFLGFYFDPSLQSQEPIDFFVRDSSDRRGQGPATPRFLGEMIAAQPEFEACMVKKVEELLFAGHPVAAETDRALRKRFSQGRDLAALLEDAVVARFLGPAALELVEAP